MIPHSDSLGKALTLINYFDRLGRTPRPAEGRRDRAEKIAGVMLQETAEAVFAELLARPVLFVDEANLLESLAERLEQPVRWRHNRLNMDGWKEGRYDIIT